MCLLDQPEGRQNVGNVVQTPDLRFELPVVCRHVPLHKPVFCFGLNQLVSCFVSRIFVFSCFVFLVRFQVSGFTVQVSGFEIWGFGVGGFGFQVGGQGCWSVGG